MNLVLIILTFTQLQFIGVGWHSTQPNIWELIDQKATELRNGREELSQIEDINPEFNSFYQRFIADSVFQRKHVNEGVLAAIGLCESTKVLSLEHWELITHHFQEDFENPHYKNLIISDKKVFYLKSTRIEIGVIAQIGFERIEGEWQLTLYMLNAC